MNHLQGGLSTRRGYVQIDNRASGGVLFEGDTKTCAHCQVVVFLTPDRVHPRKSCPRCSRYICDKPGCSQGCFVVEECIDLALANPSGGPFLARADDGGILFDPRLIEARRIY